MKVFRIFLLPVLLVLLPACACRVKQGVVTAKRAHKGMRFDPMRVGPFYRLAQPDLYWVRVRGENAHGRTVNKNIAVFRSDFSRICVGDHWSACGGFESGSTCPAHK